MRDRLDAFAEQLFDVARQEQPPQLLAPRLVRAMREGGRSAAETPPVANRRLRGRVGMALAAAAAAAAVVVLGRQSCEEVEIAAEPPRSARAPRPQPHLEPPKPAAPVERAQPPHSPEAPQPGGGAGAGRRAPKLPATLEHELTALRSARAALRSGDTQQALRELDHYEQALGERQLVAEAALLRIEALAASGRTDAAVALARRFVSERPNSPLVDRAQSFATRASRAADAGTNDKEDAP